MHWNIGVHIKNDDYVFIHLYNKLTYELYNDLEKLQYNLSKRQEFVDEYGYYIINEDISNVKDDEDISNVKDDEDIITLGDQIYKDIILKSFK